MATAGYDTVTFLSDFGVRDEFVGVVKSVIRDLARHVTVIDLTHDIAPYDVRGASLALARSITTCLSFTRSTTSSTCQAAPPRVKIF